MKKLGLLALLLAISTTVQAAPASRIALRSGAIDPASASTEPGGPDPLVRLVTFPGPPTALQLEGLAAAVDRVYTYLPDNSFLVRAIDGADLTDAMAALGASWTGPFPAAAKISPEIAAAGGDASRLRMVMIHLFPDADLGQAVEKIEQLIGKKVEGAASRARFSRIRVLLTDAQIAALRRPLADLPAVFWLERESKKTFTNDSSIFVGQAGIGAATTPLFSHGILGAGQVVAVLDTGVDIDSCYFWDAANGLPAMNLCDGGTTVETAQRKVIAVDFLWPSECAGGISNTEWDTQNHGSHVGGTVAGDDFAQPGVHNGRDGMAPQAKLVVQDCGFQTNNCADCPGIGCPVVDLVPIFQQTYDQGARIHTNSWGDEENDPAFGQYTAGSQDADEQMWAHKDFLLIFAAGNNGGTTNTVDSPSTAKSVISVGSTLRGADAGTISGFSSRGPTDDGRIKPDITFPGSNIVSAGNDANITTFNCSTATSSGTSMATPGVAGMAALTRQYYADGFYPSGAANAPDAISPSAALVKATLINSATQMTGEGNIPNNNQGWGRVLLDDAVYFAGDSRRLFATDTGTFPNGSSNETRVFQINVGAGQSFKATLAWTDFPSTPAAATNLVNDLDLEVTGPDGTFRGNVFTSGQSSTGGTADRRNNVEQVLRTSPTAGLWTVTVRSFTVPQGPQPFALVVTGAISQCAGAGNAVAAAGSETISISGGDGDLSLDNCEAARLSFSVGNTGSSAATNARVVSVSSPSHPGITFATPTWSTPSIAGCGNTTGAFVDLTGVSGLAFGDTVLVDVVITNNEIAPATRTTRLQIKNVEGDVQSIASKVYDFESGLEGWTVQSGTFVRANTLGGAGGSSFYLQSSANLANQCDVITSPEIRLTATSTLQVATRYDIEPGTPFFDRANVSVLDAGASNWVAPDGGRPYDVPNGSANGTCGTTNEGGWAGASPASWSASSWSATSLGAALLAGRPVQLDVRYGTDGGDHRAGFRIDRIELTDIEQNGPDGQSNACATGLIFANGFEAGNTGAWSQTVP